MKKTSLLLSAFFSIIFSIQSIAKDWQNKFENPNCFIENKGQFYSSKLKQDEKILYAFDDGNTKIYFTNKGVIYSFLKNKKSEKTVSEKRSGGKLFFNSVEEYKKFEREEFKQELISDEVFVEWIGCNTSSLVVAENFTTSTFSYSYNSNGSLINVNDLKGAQKLTYKSIYPGIDMEYVFHEQGGLKYSLIVHPGANLAAFKTTYNKPITINEKGQTIISTKFGDITEHAPLCFYSDNQKEIIQSKFVLNNGVLQFQLNNFNSSRKVVVDPWIQLPILNVSNSVWECERDTLGNVYIMGGDLPMKVQKYNSSGTLQWTYNTPYDTANCWLGGMVTDYVGNTYVTAGSLAGILKLDTNGSLVWSNALPITGGGPMAFGEFWSLAFNADQSELVVGGAYGTGANPPAIYAYLYTINMSNGSILQSKKTHQGSAFSMNQDVQEVRSLCYAPNCKYYFLTQDSISSINKNFNATTPLNFNQISTYSLSYKTETYRYDNAGINAIKANEHFLYTQNGTTLHKRSLATGSIVASATIPGGGSVIFPLPGQTKFQVKNSGIDIDACGNVYVGSQNAVVKFDSTLVFIDSVQLPFTVFDLTVSSNGEIIIAGSTTQAGVRTGYVASVNLNSCLPIVYSDTCAIITGIKPIFTGVENKFRVYPNPFKDNITLSYTLNSNAAVKLDVFNVLGENVQSIVNANQQAGEFKYTLENNLNAGVYFVSLTINGKTSTQRIIKMD